MQKLKKEKRLMKMQRMWRKTVKSMKKKKGIIENEKESDGKGEMEGR